MVSRTSDIERIQTLLSHFPIVAIVGARQVGKTTIARALASKTSETHYFDLEDPADLARFREPLLSLEHLKGLVIIDEVQLKPEVFPALRVLADRPRTKTRYLLLGSASPQLVNRSAESLAGRIAYHELGGFWLKDFTSAHLNTLWFRGGFPRSFLARNRTRSLEWREQFIRTFLERDMPQLGFSINAATLRRFWTMLAHFHGQVWNSSEFARSFGVADTTVRKYLDTLADALVVRLLQPWSENIGKRQVKAPRVYLMDSGVLHSLLGITSQRDLERHPKVGASWEGFLIEQLIRMYNVTRNEIFFWRTHAGSELDVLLIRGRSRYGFEIKRTVSPGVTPSMKSALTDLSLKQMFVLHAGKHSFDLTRKIRAIAVDRILADLPTAL